MEVVLMWPIPYAMKDCKIMAKPLPQYHIVIRRGISSFWYHVPVIRTYAGDIPASDMPRKKRTTIIPGKLKAPAVQNRMIAQQMDVMMTNRPRGT